jgi:6-phosphogluconolactonase
MNHKIFPDKNNAAEQLAEEIYDFVATSNKEKITIAISGGTTPFILFDIWASQYAHKMDWKKLHFFWVDERCVPHTSAESNFGNTDKVLFEKVDIPLSNIYRVRGEDEPEYEAKRYASEIEKQVEIVNGLPQFDIILLGMGDDGHTASIFPPQIHLLQSEQIVSLAQNPYNQQHRITLTGMVINNAARIYFLVTGKSKAEVVKQIFSKTLGYLKYPASHIKATHGELIWYLDEEAASGL